MAKFREYLDNLEGRCVFLDTETTGLDPSNGDRIVEIGAVEIIDGKRGENYHKYINPERSIPREASNIHGINDEDVEHESKFYQIAEDFLEYIKGIKECKLIIHNAPFDVGFINAELEKASRRLDKDLGIIEDYCQVIDSLAKARSLMPGKKNDLDSLAKRLNVDNSNRNLHGALIDSEILSDVYGGLIDFEKNNEIIVIEKPFDEEIIVKPMKLSKRPRVISDYTP